MKRATKRISTVIATTLTLFALSSTRDLSVVRAEKAEVEVSFIAEEGGMLIGKEGTKQKTMVKKVKDGTSVDEIFPEVAPDKDYKFDKWEHPEENNDSGKITSVVREYKATFFPDVNNNGKDDRNEEIEIRFDTHAMSKIDDKKIKVGEKIDIPRIKRENHIFLGWYYDKDYKEPVDFTEPFIESTTLHAKWSTTDDLTNTTSTVTIREKSMSDDIEKHLFERHRKLDDELDELAEKEKEEIQKAKETNTMTVVKYKMDNRSVGRNYLMKFYDTEENFLFSLVLPYGKTVRTVNDNKEVINEYAVRQTTTIDLEKTDFTSPANEIERYDVRNVQENSREVVEIYPVVKKQAPSHSLEEKTEDEKEVRNNTKSKNMNFYLIVSGVVLLSVSVAYVYIFKFKKNIDKDEK